MNVVRCNQCGWIGTENELSKLQTDEVDCEGRFIDYDQCPECGSLGALMDLEAGCNFWNGQLRKLWEIFGDVPINNNDEIEEDFLGFPAGTNRFDVWEWFDERYPGGVYSLAYEGGM